MPRRLAAVLLASTAVLVLAIPAHAGLETSEDELISMGSVLTQADVPAGFGSREQADVKTVADALAVLL